MTAPTPLGTSGFLGASTGNVTSLSPAVGVAVSAGDLIIVTAHAGGSTTISSVTDSQGNTYTLADSQANSSGAVVTTAIYVGVATTALGTSDTITVNRSTSGSLVVGAVSASSSYSATPRTTSKAFSNTAATAMDAAAVTDAASGELIVVAVTTQTGRTLSGNSDTTLVGQLASSGAGNPRLGGSGYIDVTSTGSVTPGLTASSGNGYAAVAVVLEPAGGSDLAAAGTVAGTSAAVGAVTAQHAVAGTVAATSAVHGTTVIPGAASATVAIIGDSLTYRSGTTSSPPSREATTRSVFTGGGFTDGNIYWYGVGGKRMLVADASGNTTADNITDAVADVGSVDIWIIGLGTNDVSLSTSAFEAAVHDVCDDIVAAGGGLILWVNLAFYNEANTNAATYNPVLATVEAARSDLIVLDWNTFVHDLPDQASLWIYPTDSTHMTVAGWSELDDYKLAAALEQVADQSAAGTVAGTSGVSGAVTAAHTVAGTVAGTSSGSGAVTAQHAVSGAVAGSSSTAGAITASHPVAGTVAGTSATVGAVTATHPVGGTVAGTSTVTGSPSLVGGSTDWAAAGTVAATSGGSGAVTATHPVTGTVAATSACSGAVTAGRATVGTVAATSTATGAVTAQHTIAGTIAATSGASGSVAGAEVPDIGIVTGSAPTERFMGNAPAVRYQGGATT